MIKTFFKRIIEFVIGPEQPEAARIKLTKPAIEPVVIKRVVRVSKEESGTAEAMLSDNDAAKKDNRDG